MANRYAHGMSTQIAVKLPEGLLDALDALVARGGARNRSDAVRRGLELLLEERRNGAIDQAFRDGYARVPETDQEMADARRLAEEAIADEPWERWW